MGKTEQQSGGEHSKIIYLFAGAIVLPFAASIGQMMVGPNKHLSSQQRNQDALVFFSVGVSAALGLAAYLYFDKKRKLAQNDGNGRGDSSEKTATAKSGSARPKDIWKVGDNSQAGLKKPKAVYEGKAFGSKYYYAHNDSNTTGGYKDGLKMEDYRMNGPRLLSVNGLSVDGDGGPNNDMNDSREEGVAQAATNAENDDVAVKRITPQDPDVKNITKYLWDDPGNGKGIATIRVDVLPGVKFGEFVNFSDLEIKDVTATLPGEGLLAEIFVSDKDTPSYQLQIKKLYGDAASVKVIIKPKRLLIKVYKKKHGFLSKNNDNLAAWPQPHRKI